MQQLKEHYTNILENGVWCPGRTGSIETDDASLAIAGATLRFNMKDGFPIATAKKTNWKAALEEMCWFIRGETNTKYLGNKIWDQWALKEDYSESEWIPEQQYIQLLHTKLGSAKLSEIAGIPLSVDQKTYSTKVSEYFVKTSVSISHPMTDEELYDIYDEDFILTYQDDIDYLRANFDTLDPIEMVSQYGKWLAVDRAELEKKLVETFGVSPIRETKRIEQGECGPIYGKQWRYWSTGDNEVTDQLYNVYSLLYSEPTSRRAVVSAWNPTAMYTDSLVAESQEIVDKNTQSLIKNGLMALPPCHYSFQFVCLGDKLSLILNMRSSDGGVGLPFNIVGYSFLLHLYAVALGYEPHELIINIGNAHIYKSHIDSIKEYIKKETHPLAKLEMTRKDLYEAHAGGASDYDETEKQIPPTMFFDIIDSIDASQIFDLIKDYVSNEAMKLDVHL